MPDRVSLTITQVKEPQKVGDKGAEKLTFIAKDGDGKEYSYFTFRTSLFDSIKPDQQIEADVEVTSREYQGNTYVDRKVAEIYVDGKPIGATKKGGGFGRSFSPEERGSIESQVAFKGIVELMVAQVLTPKSEQAKTALAWAMSKLNANIKASPKDESLPLDETSQEDTTSEPPLSDEEAQKKHEELAPEVKARVEEATAPISKELLQEIVKAAEGNGWSREDMIAFIKKSRWQAKKFSDLTNAQGQRLLEEINKTQQKPEEKKDTTEGMF